MPGSSGTATLSFEGVETFVGDARIDGSSAVRRVEHALPVLPLMADVSEILHPTATRKALMRRIEHELGRRGQPLPKMPEHPPRATKGARMRAAAARIYPGLSDGGR